MALKTSLSNLFTLSIIHRMETLPVGCRRQSDFQERRPWWEPPYVVYGFAQPQVRSRMERLMNSYVVRATDRECMVRLQLRMREDHADKMRLSIKARELAEVEREKRLILAGRMPMDDAPAELANHPVFKVTQLANKILEERRLKEEKKKRPKKLKRFNYDLLEGMEEEETEDTDLIECLEEEDGEVDVKRKLQELDDLASEGELVTDEDYLRVKYADPLVDELRELETVDELYDVGDVIVGPLWGRPCGGLLRRV